MDDNMRKLFEVINNLGKRIEFLEKNLNHEAERLTDLIRLLQTWKIEGLI